MDAMLALASRKAAMASSQPGLPVMGEGVPVGVVTVADAEPAAGEVLVLLQAAVLSTSALTKAPAT